MTKQHKTRSRRARYIDRRIEEAYDTQLKSPHKWLPIFPRSNFHKTIYRYKIALISMRIPLANTKTVKRGDFSPRMIKGEQFAKEVEGSIVKNTRTACRKGARIVLLSEYCYPFLRHNSLIIKLAELSKRYHSYIFAGSYAETEKTKKPHGICLIYTPDKPDPIIQYKHRLGKLGGVPERIFVPPSDKINVIHTEYGILIVLICADIRDDNTANDLRKLNHNITLYEPVDLVLVPSFASESVDLLRDCKMVSEQAQTCVVYVNDQSYGDQCRIYVCGVDKTKFYFNQEDNTVGHGSVHLHYFNLAALRNKRIKRFAQTSLTKLT